MKRGEVWTSSGAPDFGGKPRPVVIIQDDAYAGTSSVTICPFTTDPAPAVIRFDVLPTASNGLLAPSRMMIDKVSTFPISKLGRKIGELDAADMAKLNRALITFLGLSQPSPADDGAEP